MVWRRRSKCPLHGVFLVVVDNSSHSTCATRILRFGTEGADSSLDKGYISSYGFREVSRLASLILDEHQISVHRLLVLRCRRQTHRRRGLWDLITKHQPRLKHVARDSGESL